MGSQGQGAPRCSPGLSSLAPSFFPTRSVESYTCSAPSSVLAALESAAARRARSA